MPGHGALLAPLVGLDWVQAAFQEIEEHGEDGANDTNDDADHGVDRQLLANLALLILGMIERKKVCGRDC